MSVYGAGSWGASMPSAYGRKNTLRLIGPAPMLVSDGLYAIIEAFVAAGKSVWSGFRADLKAPRHQHLIMAYVGIAYVVIAYIVMAYIVLVCIPTA